MLQLGLELATQLGAKEAEEGSKCGDLMELVKGQQCRSVCPSIQQSGREMMRGETGNAIVEVVSLPWWEMFQTWKVLTLTRWFFRRTASPPVLRVKRNFSQVLKLQILNVVGKSNSKVGREWKKIIFLNHRHRVEGKEVASEPAFPKLLELSRTSVYLQNLVVSVGLAIIIIIIYIIKKESSQSRSIVCSLKLNRSALVHQPVLGLHRGPKDWSNGLLRRWI